MKGATHDGSKYQERFEVLQARFIDEPRAAVQEAGELVRQTVDRLVQGEQDTEGLRRLMQGYRDLLSRLDASDPEAMPAGAGARGRPVDERPVNEPARDRETRTEPVETPEG